MVLEFALAELHVAQRRPRSYRPATRESLKPVGQFVSLKIHIFESDINFERLRTLRVIECQFFLHKIVNEQKKPVEKSGITGAQFRGYFELDLNLPKTNFSLSLNFLPKNKQINFLHFI